MILSQWNAELIKYNQIIQLVKHVLFQREAGHSIDHLITQLEQAIDECQLTTTKIAEIQEGPLLVRLNYLNKTSLKN